jgi:glycine dehydrogenase subunit 1
MVTLGKDGLREVAMQSTKKAHYAYEQIIKSGKYKPMFDKPFFKEFAVSSDKSPMDVNKTLRDEGIIGGYDLGNDYPEFKGGILFAVTEKRTKDEIDKLTGVLEGI